MKITARTLCCLVVLCVLASAAFAQDEAPEPIAVNQNRVAAGKLENGTLALHLEIRKGAWHPEAENGPTLFVQAFGEAGGPAQIPGPLMRMPAGTNVHITVTNKLDVKATVYGLNTRPGDLKAGIEIAAGESKELNFPAGAPGTYYYWARTSEKFPKAQPLLDDAPLNGAYIVDAPGPVASDRIFMISSMIVLADAIHPNFEMQSINGKSYPYTEPLEYTAGEPIRWRVINTSFGEHPMHLHGAFYQLLTLGDYESDTAYPEGERQSVVTEVLKSKHTMLIEWTPKHEGRWLFHCHFHAHISTDERLPLLLANADARPPHASHDDMSAMHDMAGLVLAINVKPAPGAAPQQASKTPSHKFDLVIEPSAESGKTPTFSCSVREGKKLVASQEKSTGPAIVVTRGEPVEITVLNQLKEPTTIHWHGIELDSYYDGVMGGGAGTQMTPAIEPGKSFVARFTPNRAGTFIYHTHAAGSIQITGGVYGALIVLEPGETFDPEHDKLFVLGTRDAGFYAKRITMNGAEAPTALTLTHGVKYRLRLINMAPELAANFSVSDKDHPATWHAIAKDGATLPTRMAVTGDASLHIASGETYDFEFQPEASGELSLQVENAVNKAKLTEKIVVQ